MEEEPKVWQVSELTHVIKDLLEDAKKWQLLPLLNENKDFVSPLSEIHTPMRLLHGMNDADVPYQVSLDIAKYVASTDVIVQLIKNGNHRLSTPSDLKRMCDAVDEMLELYGT